MSFFGGLFGSNQPTEQEPSSSKELFNSANFSSAAQPPSGPAAADNINAPAPPATSAYTPSASDLFASAYDPAKLHPLAGISDNLEVLQLDDDKLSDVQGAQGVLPSRGWTDDLCVGTGTTYASGLAAGGVWGLKEGWTRPLGNNTSFKLRMNAILNACSRRGSFTGNSLGVLAIFYNLANSSIDAARGKHDALNAVGAGAISGAIYKSTAGVRPALVGATIVSAAAGGWSYFKTVV